MLERVWGRLYNLELEQINREIFRKECFLPGGRDTYGDDDVQISKYNIRKIYDRVSDTTTKICVCG